MSRIEVRRFTDDGRAAFAAAIDSLRADPAAESPSAVSAREELSELVPGVYLDVVIFASRYDLAEAVHLAFGPSWQASMANDAGLMDWIASALFGQLVADGKVGEDARYRLSQDYKKAYRHLIAGPASAYALHGAEAKLLLSTPPSSPGDLYEQLASRQEFLTNPSIIGVANELYFDPDKKVAKRGATASRRAGNLRRLIALIQQLDLTYDVYGMAPSDMVAMLPKEFDSWRGSTPELEAATPKRRRRVFSRA